MPTYEYVCRACEHEFELFQQITAPVRRKCPECGALKLERLIGPGAGVIFKGSGFYQTDYRSDSYKKAAEAESKPKDKKKASADKAASAEKTGRGCGSPSTDKTASSGSSKGQRDKGTKGQSGG